MKLIDILKETIGSKYSPSNFKLIQKGKDKEIYLLNDENYTTLSKEIPLPKDWSQFTNRFGVGG